MKSIWKILLLCVVAQYSVATVYAEIDKQEMKKGVQVDRFGNLVRDTNGKKLAISKSDMASAKAKTSNTTATQLAVSTSQAVDTLSTTAVIAETQNIAEVWQKTIFGSGIGISGIQTADIDNDGTIELILGGSTSTFGINDFWNVVEYDVDSHGYKIVWSSEDYNLTNPSEGITAIAAVSTPDGYKVVIGLASGKVEIFDGVSLKKTHEAQVSLERINQIAYADADNDGASELVLVTASKTHLYNLASLTQEHEILYGATDIAVGNVDGDSSNEIILASGLVLQFDGLNTVVEWDYSVSGFGTDIDLVDVNADGISEIVGAESWYYITTFDANLQSPIWQVRTSHDIGALTVSDVNGDGTKEILYGDGQWGSIHALNAQTGTELWQIANPEHGTTDIAVVDSDNDGAIEIIWGAGASSTGADHLYVDDVASFTREFVSTHIDGPFNAVAVGDIDADGVKEIVFVSFESDSGYGDGILFIYDSETYALEYQGGTRMFGDTSVTGVHDVAIGDVDDDGQAEIVIGTDRSYDGAIYVIDGLTRTIENTYVYDSGSPIYAVTIGDVDNDGATEIIAGGGTAHTGSPGTFVYVINGATGVTEWKSTNLGVNFWDNIYALEIADVDGDGVQEIVTTIDYLYVIDGVTHTQWQSSQGGYYGLGFADIDGDAIEEILAGTVSGQVLAINGSTYLTTPIATVCGSTVNSIRGGQSNLLPGIVQFACTDSIGNFYPSSGTISWQSAILGGSVGYQNNLAVTDNGSSAQFVVGTDRAVKAFNLDTPPVAQNETIAVAKKMSYTGTLKGSDINGDPLSFEIAGLPTMGTLVLNDAITGSYTYTANPGARITDSFTFRVFDGQAYSNIGTITVTILKPNQ